MPDMGNHLMTNHSMTNHSMINMTNTTMGTDHTGTGTMDHAGHGAGQVRTGYKPILLQKSIMYTILRVFPCTCTKFALVRFTRHLAH